MPPVSAIKSRRWRKLREQILARDGGVCYLCGSPATQVDHVVPRAVAPDRVFDPSNLRAACARCNARKGASHDRPLIAEMEARGTFSEVGTVTHAPPSPLPPQASPREKNRSSRGSLANDGKRREARGIVRIPMSDSPQEDL